MSQSTPAAAPGVELELRLQVGKYDVQQLLGKGSTGTVYLAKDQFTGREVALKTIEPEVFRDAEFGAVYRSQFQNEASLAGKLRHPHSSPFSTRCRLPTCCKLASSVDENSGQLLCGRRPFVADKLETLVQQILHEDAAPPSTLLHGLPREVDAVVLRAMKKDPGSAMPHGPSSAWSCPA